MRRGLPSTTPETVIVPSLASYVRSRLVTSPCTSTSSIALVARRIFAASPQYEIMSADSIILLGADSGAWRDIAQVKLVSTPEFPPLSFSPTSASQRLALTPCCTASQKGSALPVSAERRAADRIAIIAPDNINAVLRSNGSDTPGNARSLTFNAGGTGEMIVRT